tara:strand:+ start:155 stop:943 length:789 start_codon:yes stop_codon:yes gene_type:complete
MSNNSVISELTERWLKSGLNDGDIFLLHSDTRRLLIEFFKKKKKINLTDIVNSFLNIAGKNGTLLMPLFNFSEFTKNKFFSIKNTKSMMGILTEEFRKNFKILRTKHPIYSFAVAGKNIDKFNLDNFSAYGKDSPFEVIKKLNGKIAILDLPEQKSMTFYHHIEESNNVEWRYHKIFKGIYEDYENKKSEKEYSVFVRKLEKNVITHVDPAGELLWSEGLYKGSRPNTKTGLRVINASQMYEFISKIILDGKANGILYKQSR